MYGDCRVKKHRVQVMNFWPWSKPMCRSPFWALFWPFFDTFVGGLVGVTCRARCGVMTSMWAHLKALDEYFQNVLQQIWPKWPQNWGIWPLMCKFAFLGTFRSFLRPFGALSEGFSFIHFLVNVITWATCWVIPSKWAHLKALREYFQNGL